MAITTVKVTSFRDYIKQIKKGGSLIIHESIADLLASDIDHVKKHIYSMSRGQFFAGNITAHSGFLNLTFVVLVPKNERVGLVSPVFIT